MAVTLLRLEQIRKTDNPDDTLSASAIANIESTAVDGIDFLTGELSQIKRIIHGGDSGNWHDDIATVFGGSASLKTLFNRATLEGKNVLTYLLVLNDMTVTASQNWMELSSTYKPGKNIAYGASAIGAVCAKLAGAIGSHSLTESSGSDALHPKNLVQVFDGDTGDAILSSGRRIYGLLQVGSAATDGNAFADSGDDQGQISFVRPNSTFDDLEACPVADIQGKKVIYCYTRRDSLKDTEEVSFRGDLDLIDPSGVTVSLDSAYDGGYYMTVDGTDVDIRLADTKSWVFRAGSGGSALVTVTRNDSTGDLLKVETDKLDVNSTDVDFADGIKVDTGGNTINVGVTGGQIDSAALEVEATAGDLNLKSSADVNFTTDEEASGIDLDDATAGPISGLFSQSFASISAAIKYAGEHGGVDLSMKAFVAASNYAQGVNIPAAVQDLTAYPIDMNTPAGVKQLVFLNGRLLFGGNGTTKNDCYAGTTPASGDLMVDFAKGIKIGDVIISVVLAE